MKDLDERAEGGGALDGKLQNNKCKLGNANCRSEEPKDFTKQEGYLEGGEGLGGDAGGDRKGEQTGERKPMNERRRGKVARLPREVRQKINEMLDDGLVYREIIERLGEAGKGLSESNLSRWKDGGFKDWLAERAFLERIRARQETPRELVRDFDATEVNHAALQLGTLHIFEALRELGPGSLNEKLGGDCAAFARLINALARASRETMQLQRYREACEKAREVLRELDPKRKLDESETRAIVRQVDELLGLAQPQEVLEKLEKGSRLGVIEERTEEELAGREFPGPGDAKGGPAKAGETGASPVDATRQARAGREPVLAQKF